MKDRKGPVGRVTELAVGFATAARRSRAPREPRVVVYDAAGPGRVLMPSDAAYEPLLAAGRELIGSGPTA